MKVEIDINENYIKPKAVIHTKEITDEVIKALHTLSNTKDNCNKLLGYKDGKIIPLVTSDIIRIYSENQKTYSETKKGILLMKLPLYKVEELLSSSDFVRISQSEIVNFKEIENFDMNYTGTIVIIFKSGNKSYVSRRYIKKIKDYLGIWGEYLC